MPEPAVAFDRRIVPICRVAMPMRNPKTQVDSLEDAYDAAPSGAVRCIEEYPENASNLRTQFARILRKAHVETYPRLFHNLRASCRTELQEKMPEHAINKWLGQSSRVAEEHYITVHDEHWDRALKLASFCPPTRPPITVPTGTFSDHQDNQKPNDLIDGDGLRGGERYPRRGSNPQPQASEACALSN